MVGFLAASIVLLGAIRANAAAPDRAEFGDAPRESGVIEHAERRLGQVEVALTGPRSSILGLTLSQFDVTIDGRRVTPVAVDPLCPGSPARDSDPGSPVRTAGATSLVPTSYLFYFDQRNLTMAGRATSLETAAAMIPKLIRGGNRGAIVSSGKRIVTFASFSDRSEQLLEALGRLRADTTQWDDYPTLEGSRELEVMSAKSAGSEKACLLASTYQREELGRSQQALELFLTVLGRFSGVNAPKVAVYFADTLRDEPGRHYFATVGGRCERVVAPDTRLSFQRIHGGAAALGVKLYAVQAEGLMSPSVMTVRGARDVAERDAKGGLKALTLDTGGDAFLNGASVDSMLSRIEADAACIYLISFDPKPFPEDQPLAVEVDVKLPGVRARTRSHIVMLSESARRMALLLAAFTAPDDLKDSLVVRGGVVPLDVERGKLRMLVQASLPETELPRGETWDIGMSLVSGTEVRHEASGRVAVDKRGVRIVLESDVEVGPGPFDVSLAAVEDLTGKIGAGRISGSWPGRTGPNQVVAIAVLQPTEGAFLRDGSVRHSGSLVIAEDQPLRADRPIAFVTLVCRAERRQVVARVHRKLMGDKPMTFVPIDLSLNDTACAQVRDVVPANSLMAGPFTYAVTVEGAEGNETRAFVVE